MVSFLGLILGQISWQYGQFCVSYIAAFRWCGS